MTAALRSLLANILDYAGLFPPAALPLDDSIRNYAGYLKSDDRWMLARLAKVRVRGQALDLQSDGSPRLSPQLRSAKPRTADYGSSTRSKSERAAPRRPPAKRPPGKGPPWGKPRHRD